jgi:hypothetical protein
MRQASKRVADSAEKTVRDIRRATRKIRIVENGAWLPQKRTPSALILGVAKLLPQLGF